VDPGAFDGIGGAAAEAEHRRRACTRKDRYRSETQAKAAMRWKERVYHKRMGLYRCPFDRGHFHLFSEESRGT
jgi:hypothetical protein